MIAKLLDCEGFSDYTANQIERYWKNQVMRPKPNGRINNIEAAFAEFAKTMTPTQKMVLGKWVKMRDRIAFDAGLRLGLMRTLHGLAGEREGAER